MITIHTLVTASAQDVFNQLAKHLLNMEAPCFQANGVIGAYHFAGQRSPAGSLIPDSDYLSCMENRSWVSMAHTGLVPKEHAELIGEIEYVHDSFPASKRLSYLMEIAMRHNLSKTRMFELLAA